MAHTDQTFRKRINQLAKLDLLILDDLGINALTPEKRSDLLEVIECRSVGRATIVTSQLPVKRWHDYLGEGNPTVGDAILDRLTTGAQRIELDGESMRARRKPDPGKK